MRTSRCVFVILMFAGRTLFASSPATPNNDDSCEISVAPAATLLLPYFEVNLSDSTDETTLFTITNAGSLPQIARATIWTDWAYPVLTFNIFLTGYDIQTINLYDVLARGRIANPGTSSDAEAGQRSPDNDANNLLDISGCKNVLNDIPPQILADLRSALTAGRTTACGNARIGSLSPTGHAIGYATIDVVRNCGAVSPVDAGYFENEILYDNILIGDYQQLTRANNFAQGSTLVHIRAIPEGGLSGSASTNFRRTFYSRFQNGGTADRRQPLPSTFAARWISGGPGGLNTSFKIWREGVTGANAGCAVAENITMNVPDIVRFDEEGNPTVFDSWCGVTTCPEPFWSLPVAARVAVDDDSVLPFNHDGSLDGWMYFNLTNDRYRPLPDNSATQSWVVVSMEAEGRFSVDFDAAFLGNGCSPPALVTAENGSNPAIGPAPDVNP